MLAQWSEWADQFTSLDIALWVVGWGILFLFLAPYLVTFLGIRIVKYEALDGPADQDAVRPDGRDPAYAERFEEAAALGFQPAGAVVERVWFYQDSIRRTAHVNVLVSEDGLTYAALYRVGRGGPVRVALDSFTESGVLVRTAMPGAGIPEKQHDFHRTEVGWRPVGELLHAHQRELSAVGKPIRVCLAERAAFDEKVETRTLKTIGVGDSFWLLAAWIVPFLLTVGALWATLNLSGPTVVGLSLLAAAGSYAVVTVKVIPWLIGVSQYCDESPERSESDQECEESD